jgi:hypothetical protein
MLRSKMLRSMTLNADYFTPLSRAVASIDRDDYAARFAIYDREHKALLRRLATADSPCSDADVVREEQAFRDAIRRIEFADEDQPTLVPQDEPAEEPAPRRDPTWPQVRPADLRPADTRRMPRETFEESPLPDIDPPEPGIAVEPPAELAAFQISEPRSVARRVGERLLLAVVVLIVAAAAWMGEGRDATNSTTLRGAAEPSGRAASDDTTAAKAVQPTWLSPEILFTPLPAPPSSPTPGPTLASAPRPDVPLPVPRPEPR